jgi:hypothetical protein
VLVGLFDQSLPRWAGPAGLLLFGALIAGQVYRMHPTPRSESPARWLLGQALQRSVPSNAYLVTVAAPDSGLRLPLAARRRTLSLMPEQAENEASMQAALAAMGNEPLGAVVLGGNTAHPADLAAEVARLTGRELQLAFTYKEWTVYLPKAGLRPAADELMIARLPGVALAPGTLPDPQWLAGERRELAELWRFQRVLFEGMQPAPVSFYSTFGPDITGDGTGEWWYNAHPVTRLRFRLPPGPHRLLTRVMMQPAAFDPALPPNEQTNGVDFQLAAVGPEDERLVLHARLIDPVHNAADRQPQDVDLRFTLPPGTELEIFFGPGPGGRVNRDWVYLGRLRID